MQMLICSTSFIPIYFLGIHEHSGLVQTAEGNFFWNNLLEYRFPFTDIISQSG